MYVAYNWKGPAAKYANCLVRSDGTGSLQKQCISKLQQTQLGDVNK